MHHLGLPRVVADGAREAQIRALSRTLEPLSPAYVVKEVDYLLGRFEPENIEQYVAAEPTGRGLQPVWIVRSDVAS